MSDNLTPQQYQTFIYSLLLANSSTGRWFDFWNPNTHINRGLENPMFDSIDKGFRIILKQILQQNGVVIEQNGNMTFPENFQSAIPRIVEEFMRRRSLQATEAIGEAPVCHAVCAGGCGAVAEASSPPAQTAWKTGASGWSVPAPKNQQVGSGCAKGGRAVSESHDDKTNVCPYAGGRCRFHGTWGGCQKLHPVTEPKSGKLPVKGGPSIMVCKNGRSCKHGDNCWFPHPTNTSCVVEQRETNSGQIHIAKVCTLKKCNGDKCPCAHLPQDVIDKALERKEKAFSKSSRGGVACSAVSRSAFDFSSVLEADFEVASLTGALQGLSLEKPHCGGGAHACSLPTASGSLKEGDLLGLLSMISLKNDNQAPPASAPPMVVSSVGQWNEFIDPRTGVSYFQNQLTGEVSYSPPEIFENASGAVICEAGSSRIQKRKMVSDHHSASCAVVRRKVEQEDESQSPKPTKRSADSDSCPESSKKSRQ